MGLNNLLKENWLFANYTFNRKGNEGTRRGHFKISF